MQTITHRVTSSLPGGVYAGITEDYELPVEITDDDAGGVLVTQTGGSTIVDERDARRLLPAADAGLRRRR